MRILDKYILKEITIPILFCLYVLVFLFLIADLFDNLYEIINNKTPLIDIITYYLYLIPFAIVQTISWATLLGTIYLFTSFTRHNEIIAMKACGLKITKIAGPILFLGIIIGVVTFIINDRIVPKTFHAALNIKKEKIDINSTTVNTSHILKNTTLLSNNRQYFIKNYYTKNNRMEDIRIHFLNNDNLVEKKIVAQKAEWINNKWIMYGLSIYHLDKNGRIIGNPEVSLKQSFPELTERPQDFIEASFDSSFLSSKELENYIKRLKDNGLNANPEYSALHNKRSFPWQSLVIMFMIIPLLGRTGTVRAGFAKNILLCLILVFVYHVLSAVSIALGSSGILLPFISAWLANFIFTTGGIIFLEKANY